MADEILSKLGFDVQQALDALRQLDSQLNASGTAFNAHAQQLNAWNTQARAALATMKEMAQTAGGITLPTPPSATPTAAQPAGGGLWLPPGLQTQINQANQGMSQLAGTAASAGNAMTQAGATGGQALNGASQSAGRLFMSLKMIGRIIMTQLIVRTLSQIRNALREATTSAIELQRSLAEIEAISPPTASFERLGAEAAAAAARFNIPLPDVAEGMYQTISNQFVEVSERARVMEASMKLARVGVMDVRDSVLLLTGALNAYGESSSNVELVAAKFFRTIQLGRVRGKELADTIGQVVPIAAQLGISLDEVTASYVSMTIGGLDARKSATSLRQAMLAFIKPSEDMKKVLKDLGYANAEQIIQAEGWGGALDKVAQASDGMVSEVAKSIRRVRALTGVLSLTREESEKYNEALEAMKNVTADSMEEIYKQFTSMPAEALTKEINKLKVTLTRDFGNMLSTLLGDMVKFVGGADRISAALQTIAKAGVVLGVGLLALSGYLAITSAAFASMWAAMGPIGWVILGISAAITVLVAKNSYATAMMIADIRRTTEERRAARMEELREIEDAQREEMEALRKQNQERNQIYQQGMADVRKTYYKAIDALKDKDKELIDSTRETLGSMVKSQERVVSAYRKSAQAAANAVSQSRQRQISAESEYADAVFKYSRQNEGAYRKAESYMSRAAFLAKEAQEAMTKARTPEQISAAQAIFQRAEAAAQEAENLAQGTKSSILQGDAQRRILFIMRQKIESEQTLQKIQAEEAQRLAQKAAEEQKHLNEMKTLMKTILTDLQAFDKKGPKDPLQLKGQQERLNQSIQRMRELWLRGDKVDVGDMLAFDKLQQRVQTVMAAGVDKVEVQELWAAPERFASFREQIEKGIGPVRVMFDYVIPQLPARLQEALKGTTAEESMDIFSHEMTTLGKIMEDYKDMGNKFSNANTTIAAAQRDAVAALDQWVNTADVAGTVKYIKARRKGFIPLGEWAKTFEEFIKEAGRFTDMPVGALNTEDFERLNTAYTAYLEALDPPETVREALLSFMQEAELAASTAEQRAKLLQGLQGMETRATEAQSLMPLLEEGLNRAKAAMQESDSAIQKVKTETAAARGELTSLSQTDMSNLVSQIGQAANNMWNLASASQSVQMPTGAELAARGGRAGRYLAMGGPAGTDVVPSWLSRGEFVMNAGSASKFASQLVAMNAGVQPNFRSDGGSVTNIGDINVTVSGGATGRQTARSIAAELRRELRRGTTTL